VQTPFTATVKTESMRPVRPETAAKKPSSRLWPALALLASLPAAAADFGERRIVVGGFGTIGALYHDEEGIEYRRSVSQPRGAEAGEVDFATDTIGGLQINAAWTQELETVVQGVTRLSADGDWDPQLTRAFLRYNPNETVSLRVGRFGWDIYPRSDSRDVGYSNLTIRPSVEVFGVAPTEHHDGGEMVLKRLLGGSVISLTLFGAAPTGEIAQADGSVSDLEGSRLWGAHVEYAPGPWLLRLGTGVFLADEPPPLEALAAGLQMTGVPEAVALGEDFASRERKIEFYVAGATYEEGPAQVRLFAAHVHTEQVAFPEFSVAQIVGGYRVGQLTPYASYSWIGDSRDVRGTGLPDDPQLAPLNAGAYAVQAANRYEQQTLALGLRWDFLPKLALKLEVDQVWIDDSRLVFDDRPDPSEDAEMTLIGLALDFVF
jgi:hypothetical protein